VLAPVIPAYRPNGQCPIWSLVTHMAPVRVGLGDVIVGVGVVGVGAAVVGVGTCARCRLGRCVRCGLEVCVRCGPGLCGADSAAGADTLFCDEQPTAAMAAAAVAAARTVRARNSLVTGSCLSAGPRTPTVR
jgi:hypothetical protein